MSFFTILAFAVGLSMDAFAVSVCKGLGMKKINTLHMLLISFFFGFFQFLMPVVGYFLCIQFESYVVSFDHWIAFILLSFIGGKMVFEALKERKEKITEKQSDKIENSVEESVSQDNSIEEKVKEKFSVKEIIFLAIATSIDALAVGITFAFTNVNIFMATSIIGITTFVLCCVGVLIGNFFGTKFKTYAEVTGGIILVLMGIKILLEHLGVLVF